MNGERELDAAFAANAPGALEEAYRRYGSLLASAARHVLGSEDDARDCVHEALVRVWSRHGAYRLERGSLRAFLVVCVRNEALSKRRGAQRAVALERRVAGVVPAVDHTERIAVRAALAALSREQRDAIELAYWGDYSQSEIASRLAVPLGTVKSRVSLGLRKLARALRSQD